MPLLGVVPESSDVLKSTNVGRPVILQDDSDARALPLEHSTGPLGLQRSGWLPTRVSIHISV